MQLLLPQQFASFDENVLGEANLQPCHFTFASFALRFRVRRVHEKTEDDCSKCTILQSSTAQHLTSSDVVVTQLNPLFTCVHIPNWSENDKYWKMRNPWKTVQNTVKRHRENPWSNCACQFVFRKYVYIYIYTRALKVALIKFINLDPLSDANWRVLSNTCQWWQKKHIIII